MPAEPAGFDCVSVGDGHVAATSGEVGKSRQHIEEEEREPDAFALAMLAHEVHSVVPVAAAHERQAVNAEPQAVVDRADAVVIEASLPSAMRGRS